MWQLGAGSGVHSKRSRLRRRGPLRESPWAGPSRLRSPGSPGIAQWTGNGTGIGGPPAPEKEGRSSLCLRLRSELPPEAAAGSSLPAGEAARQGALLAQRSGVLVLGLSPGGRDLPRATGSARGPHRLPGSPAAWLGASGACAKLPAPAPDVQVDAPDVPLVLQAYTLCRLLLSLAARAGGHRSRRIEANAGG